MLNELKEKREIMEKCPKCNELKSTVDTYPDHYANMNGDCPDATIFCCLECYGENTDSI